MGPTLDQISCACLPPAALAVLADLRRVADVRIIMTGDRAWVRWPAGDARVLERVLPVRGVVLYAQRDGLWFQPGRHLPDLDLPAEIDADTVPLSSAIVPARLAAVAEPRERVIEPVRLRLVRDARIRTSSALRCGLDELARWAEGVPSTSLARLNASTDGQRVLIIGAALPTIADGDRFWGDSLLVPLGFRIDPDLPAEFLIRAFGGGSDSVVAFGLGGAEVMSRSAFRPLSRSGIRLALGDGPP